MIRPRTGRTPDNERQQKALTNLRAAGGDKVAAQLPPEAMSHLHAIMADRECNKTQAIIFALAQAAKKLLKARN